MSSSELVAKSPPDGHTLAFVSAGHTMNPAMYPKTLPYHPVKDFSPVSMLASGAQVLVVNWENKAPERPQAAEKSAGSKRGKKGS